MRVKLRYRRLAEELARSPLSLNRWAQKMGLARGHLSELVNGKRRYVSPKTREKLMDALGLTFDELFEVEHGDRRTARPAARAASLPRVGLSVNILDAVVHDLALAVRSLSKRPGFTLAAVLTLALGIGSNATLFSFVNGVFLRPFPYERPEELVAVFSTLAERGHLRGNLSYPDFRDIRASLDGTGLVDIAVHDWEPYALSDGEAAVRVGGGRVSANLFEVLGVEPILGRTFRPEEDAPGAERVVVLSEQVWRGHFGSDPRVVGRRVLLNGSPHSVIGVLPEEGAYPERARLWVTLADYPARENRGAHGLQSTGRLAPGTTVQSSTSALETIASRLESMFPDTNEDRGARVEPLREALVGEFRVLSMTLFVAVAFVLLIVCANVANLLLARGVAREREMAIRTALGASRRRLVRQLLTESLVLATLGCFLGLGLGALGVAQIPSLVPIEIPAWIQMELDVAAVVYTVGISFLAAILFGLAPAIQIAQPNLGPSLREGSRTGGATAGRRRFRAALVVSEVALSLALLVGAGLMVQSLLRLSVVDPGFETQRRLSVGIDLLSLSDRGREVRSATVERLLARLGALPGVESVAVIDRMPLKGSTNMTSYRVEAQSEEEARANPFALYARVSSAYFETMGIPLREGSSFREPPDAGGPLEVVVSESLADRFWPGESAVGKRIQVNGPGEGEWASVTGVVGDIRHFALHRQSWPSVYVPYYEEPTTRLTWVLRTSGEPLALADAVRAAVRSFDPHQPIHELWTLDELVGRSYWHWRFFGRLFWIFTGLALVLALVGIYGVMSYSVSQRTHEVGVRMALGAKRRQVVALVLRQGYRLVLWGLIAGVPLALMIGRVLAGALYDVRAFEAGTFLAVAALLGLTAFVAILFPARRAARVDPTLSLRYE